jgi:hypothetical protein
MYTDKQEFIKWLTEIINRSEGVGDVDSDKFHCFIVGLNAVFRDVLKLNALASKLDNFEKCLDAENYKESKVILHDINDNWNFYTDQVINKLTEENRNEMR